MSMFNDIEWTNERNKDVCVKNSMVISEDAKRCPHGHWSFFGPGSGQKIGTGPTRVCPSDNGITLRKIYYSTSPRVDIPYSVAQVRSKEEL